MTDSAIPNKIDVRRRSTFLLIAVCFLLSGFAALLYETVWLRQFAIILGTSEQALAVILASYMGGLSIGAWVAGRRVDHIRHPVWLYGILEAGIALCALAMPWGLAAVAGLQVQLFGGVPEPPAAGSFSQIAFGLVAAFSLIVLPTAMMGATLPLLAKQVVQRDQDLGPRVGVLYGINTLGAVAGTLAAAFVFLPEFGLRRTTWIGAGVNLAIFVLIAFTARRFEGGVSTDKATSDPEEAVTESRQSYNWVLAFAAAAGAIAFSYEILFTRMLGHVLGGSIFAFATMLAGFLLGIALGGMGASRLAVRRDWSIVALVYAQCLSGVSALAAYHAIETMAGWSFQDWGGRGATASQVMVSIVVLLPTAVFLGATFPLATRILARDHSEAGSGSARVYFWNTIGAIIGALATGIVVLPTLAYHGTACLAIALNAGLALLLLWGTRIRPVHLTAVALTMALLFMFIPPTPERLLRASVLDAQPTQGDLIFSHVGRSGTVVLFDQHGDIRFMTNGLPEAIVAQKGSEDPYASSGAWLSALPPLIRPEARSMLIVGLGGGVAAAHVPPSIKSVDIFELEPAVVEANEFIRDRRNRDPLADDRVKLILNDGRNGLALTSKSWDVIVSQPSHPWTAGSSHLYTREFAATAHRRLKPGGVFVQWMNVEFVNPALFRSLAATLLDVFQHVRVYEPFPGNALFVASDERIEPEATSQETLELNPRDVAFYEDFGMVTPTHLLAMLRFDEPELRELAREAPLITDEYNLLAMRAPQAILDRGSDEMQSFNDTYAIYSLPAERIRSICPTVHPIALATRLLARDCRLPMSTASDLLGDDTESLLLEAILARKNGEVDRWAQLLREAASQRADDPRPAFLLLARHSLGSYDGLDDDETRELAAHLDSRYRDLLSAIEAVRINDLQSVREQEAVLASFEVDDVGYDMAVRLRCLWRIGIVGANYAETSREALRLISKATPTLGLDALISFRVAAAVGAEEPDIALASSVGYAKSVIERIQTQSVTSPSQLQNLRTNLIKCRSMIGDRIALRKIPEDEYRAALDFLDKVIAGEV